MTKTLSVFALAMVAGVASASITFTENLDTTTITFGNSVSCNAGGLHTDNSYLRDFHLADYGIAGAFTVQNVRIGVEQATSSSGSQTIWVNVYDGVVGTFAAMGAPVWSGSFSVGDQSLSFLDLAIGGTVTSGNLTIQIFTPDGQAAGNSFFIGSNANGETGPSYLAAPDCGVGDPLTVASLGFGNMHTIMVVTGVPAPGAAALLGLGGMVVARRRR